MDGCSPFPWHGQRGPASSSGKKRTLSVEEACGSATVDEDITAGDEGPVRPHQQGTDGGVAALGELRDKPAGTIRMTTFLRAVTYTTSRSGSSYMAGRASLLSNELSHQVCQPVRR